ncbi:hypothetical protein [Dietzia timorensis]|uniref:Uncharacterized protein n=1 Tax=Dietzia timorensis TaxID=499555 RepID=A0A173LIE8_9ACTN|nr:hypothetical protein [Dietzia timorensis]ANI91673.1 Hypothetical protein BJL86_0879 [Dietzia timorensis]
MSTNTDESNASTTTRHDPKTDELTQEQVEQYLIDCDQGTFENLMAEVHAERAAASKDGLARGARLYERNKANGGFNIEGR